CTTATYTAGRAPAAHALAAREGPWRCAGPGSHQIATLSILLFAIYGGLPTMSVVSPWAILTCSAWLTVQAVLWVTASISPAAEGWPLPLFLTPPNGRWTSAPMQGRF